MKQDNIENTEEKLHPQFADQLLFWQERAKNAEIYNEIESLWALQYRQKYLALRKVGFGKLTALIMILKVMK